jgi:hypothetical protein
MPSTASRVAAFGLTAAIGLTLSGCAASLPDAGPAVVQRTTVVIAPDGSQVLPFALADGRVAVAARRLEAVLGHGVQVQVDSALMPADREHFIQALAGAIDNTAAALEGERARSPNTFVHGAPQLHVIACQHDTLSNHVRLDLDEVTGMLRVRLPGPAAEAPGVPPSALFEPVVVRHAIEGAYSAWLYTRFSGVDPDRVEVAERGFYADYLAHIRAAPSRRRSTAPPIGEMSRLVR